MWWRDGTFANVITESVLDGWRDAGVEEGTITAARALLYKPFVAYKDYVETLQAAVGASALAKLQATLVHSDHVGLADTQEAGPTTGFSARGWLGEQLVVIPSVHVVAVRMRAPERTDYAGHGSRDEYPGFTEDIARLVHP